MNILALKNEFCGKREILVDIPNSDACMILARENDYENYLQNYGNVNVVPGFRDNVFAVPEFVSGRNAFIAAKIEDCKRWGCE